MKEDDTCIDDKNENEIKMEILLESNDSIGDNENDVNKKIESQNKVVENIIKEEKSTPKTIEIIKENNEDNEKNEGFKTPEINELLINNKTKIENENDKNENINNNENKVDNNINNIGNENNKNDKNDKVDNIENKNNEDNIIKDKEENINKKDENIRNPKNKKQSCGGCLLCFMPFIILIIAIGLGIMFPDKANEVLINLNKILTKKNGEENILKNDEIIIGVDFGSTQSGYQIFYNSEIGLENNENNKIITTELIFDLYFKKGLSIGEQAKYFPKENIEKENKLYFAQFKRNLDPKIKSNMANASIPVGGQLENDIVIMEFLRLMKDYIINNVEKINYSNIKDVKWVLTVPPLWDDSAKKKMKEIAKKAEMSNVQIALEPEVASLAIFYDKNMKKELLKPGTSFLIVDMGGYTVDFTAMKILDENKNLEQLLKPVSFTFGSNLINAKIIEIIEKAYNKDKLEKVKKTNYRLWEKTLDEIEEKKKEINNNEAKNFRISINFNEGKCSTWSDNCILKYNDIDIPYTSQYIDIPGNLVLDIINDLTNKIVDKIKDKILESTEQINLIILTGGFSNNIILREKINNYLKSSFKQKVFLDEPEKTVMKGAALFGIKPNQIIKRIIPVSIGILLDDNKYFTFVKRGESIETNKVIEKQIVPLDNKIQIYYSDENEEINEENKKYLDEIEIPYSELPLADRTITISMKFSSFISVKLNEKGIEDIEPKILYYPS